MKIFDVYKQVFKFKVSYFIISAKGYIPNGAKLVGSIVAPSRNRAAEIMKQKTETGLLQK